MSDSDDDDVAQFIILIGKDKILGRLMDMLYPITGPWLPFLN